MTKNLLLAIFLLISAVCYSQNVGINTTTPAAPLDVNSPNSLTTRFNSSLQNMFIGFYESNAIRGYVGSYSGAAEDVDLGTAVGNSNGKVHLTTSSIPRLTVDKNGAVGIGTMLPNLSAALDLSSGTRGFLAPRMTSPNRTNINQPAKGLMVYDSTLNEFYYHDGISWLPFHQKNYRNTGHSYYGPAGLITTLEVGLNNVYVDPENNNGILYDNGGANGNYFANFHSYCLFGFDDSTLAIKISLEQLQTEAGVDELFIITGPMGAPDTIGRFSGTQTGATFTLYEEFRVSFKTNGTNQQAGFALRWGRIRPGAQFQTPSPHFGWHFIDNKMAARGGLEGDYEGWEPEYSGRLSFSYGYNAQAPGGYGISLGKDTRAAGYAAAALGNGSVANGDYSMAVGNNAFAGGEYSFATGMNSSATGEGSASFGWGNYASGATAFTGGWSNEATGFSATAFGFDNTASGGSSFAAGSSVQASGNSSVAMGSKVNTNNRQGTFFFGDSDPHNKGIRNAGANDQFVCRFNGGYYFISSNAGAADLAVHLPPGGNNWVSISNKYKKENFELTNGEVVLQKLKNIPLGSWNYIGQDAKTNRHYGIMAQDFYEAYGKDSYGIIGCDTAVNTVDMQGVAFSAIQALEKRTSNEAERIASLEAENAEMRKAIADLRKQIEAIKK